MKKLTISILFFGITILLQAQYFDDGTQRSHLADQEKCILFGDDFEKACFDVFNPKTSHSSLCSGEGVLWKHGQLQGPHAIAFVSDTVRAGTKAVRFKWLHSDPGGWEGNPEKVSNKEKKAMLHAPGVRKHKDSERWYGFSMFFPSEGMKKDKYPGLVFQLHATPDHDLDEPWRQPPVAMTLGENGMVADWTWDSVKVSPKNENIIKNRTYIEFPGTREDYLDRWVDFVCHVKVDYTAASKGFIEIWVDGEKVADKQGIMFGYNDELGLYPSYGLYWYKGKGEHDHWLYVDEIRIGGPDCSYEDVAPRSK